MPEPSEAFSDLFGSTSSRKVMLVKIRTLFEPESWGVIEYFPEESGVFSTHNHIGPAYRFEGDVLTEVAAFYHPLVKSVSFVNALVSGSAMRGRTEPDTATITILNNAEVAALSSIERDTIATIELTSPVLLPSDALEVFSGVVDQISPSRDGRTVTASLRSFDSKLDVPANSATWQGFGPAVEFESTTSTIEVEHDDSFNIDGAFTLEIVVRLGHWDPNPGGLGVVVNREGTSGAFDVTYDFDNERFTLSVFDDIGSIAQVFYSVGSEAENAVARQWMVLSLQYDESEIRVYRDGTLVETKALPEGWSGHLPSTSAPLHFGTDGNELSFRGALAEARLWSVIRTPDEMAEWSRKPIVEGSSESLVFLFRFNEGLGAATWDDERAFKGGLSSVTWTPSYTGDPELSGKRRPTSWGWVWHRDAIMIDSGARIYAAHSADGACVLLRVFEGAAARIPSYSVSVGAATHDAARKRITITGSATFPRFAKFIPGQLVTIASGLNAGDVTVTKVDEIEGLWMEVEESISGGTQATAVNFSTKSGTAEWSDAGGLEAFGMFEMNADAQKPVTCRILGQRHSTLGATVPGLMVAVAEAAIPNLIDAHFGAGFSSIASAEPHLAGWATGDEAESVSTIWSKLSSSIGALYGAFGQTFLLWMFEAPAAFDPETTPTDPNVLLLTQDEIIRLEWLRTAPPVEVARVLYRHNFRKMSREEIVLGVLEDNTAGGREHLQFVLGDGLSIEAGTRTSAAAYEDELSSLVIDADAALLIARRNLAAYGVSREVFGVTVKTQPYTVDWRTCSVGLIRPDWDSLISGKLFRILRRECSRKSVRLEVWG